MKRVISQLTSRMSTPGNIWANFSTKIHEWVYNYQFQSKNGHQKASTLTKCLVFFWKCGTLLKELRFLHSECWQLCWLVITNKQSQMLYVNIKLVFCLLILNHNSRDGAKIVDFV